MTHSDALHVERRGEAVVLLTLDRPDRRNAVDAELCERRAEAVQQAAEGGARAIVLAGTGPHFCAGADLKTLEDEHFATILRRALDAFRDAPVCTIAAVQGAALGAGTQLAIACDVRVATPDARFGIPAAKLGLMVDHWTVQRLALLAGYGSARSMLLSAEEVSGEHAHHLGLVQRIGTLDDALQWADKVATLAPLSIAGHKLALNRLEPPLASPDVTAAFQRAWRSEDLVEGQRAFAEKRAPDFRGR